MTEKEKKAEIVRYWWDRAQESLRAARRELAADSYNFAMNRIYYALFYAVSALLRQEEHHRKKTFQEEYVEILQKSGVEYDERYLW